MSEQDILARTIYGEARGEGYDGMVAVACVIRNRVWAAQDFMDDHDKPHPLFGNGTFVAACTLPWQFSCWNRGDPNYGVIETVTAEEPIFAECLNIAQKVIDGDIDDTTDGATYYYDRRSPEPKWALGKTPCVSIGHHLFFNNVN